MKPEYDFSNGVRNPYYGKYIKDGKYIVVVEHDDYNEIIEVDVNTGQKTKLREEKKQA